VFQFHSVPSVIIYNFLLGDVIDEQTATFEGYTSFFSFSRARSGYSGKNKTAILSSITIYSLPGVATLCKSVIIPVRAEEGLTGQLVPPNCTDSVGCNGSSDITTERMKLLDSEGRALITQFKLNVILFSCFSNIMINAVFFRMVNC
jgi:AP endonuclease 2